MKLLIGSVGVSIFKIDTPRGLLAGEVAGAKR